MGSITETRPLLFCLTNVRALAVSAVLLFVALYFHGGLHGIRAGKMLALVLLVSLLWATLLARKVSWSAGYLMAVAAISSISAGFGPTHTPVLVFVFCGTVVMWWCADVGLPRSRLILWSLIAAGVVQALYGYMQAFGIDPLFQRLTTQDAWVPVGTMGQQTLYGPFIASACAAALFICPPVLILLLPAALLTLSSMTYVSLCAVGGVFVCHFYGARKLVLGMLGVGVLVLLGLGVFPNLFIFDDQGRFEVWASAVGLWWQRPLLGYGLGSYPVLAPLDQSVRISEEHGYFIQAHNDYLQALFETGLIGVVGVVWALVEAGRGAIRVFSITEGRAWTAVFFAIAVNALGNFPFHVAPLALVGVISWTFLVTRR